MGPTRPANQDQLVELRVVTSDGGWRMTCLGAAQMALSGGLGLLSRMAAGERPRYALAAFVLGGGAGDDRTV